MKALRRAVECGEKAWSPVPHREGIPVLALERRRLKRILPLTQLCRSPQPSPLLFLEALSTVHPGLFLRSVTPCLKKRGLSPVADNVRALPPSLPHARFPHTLSLTHRGSVRQASATSHLRLLCSEACVASVGQALNGGVGS